MNSNFRPGPDKAPNLNKDIGWGFQLSDILGVARWVIAIVLLAAFFAYEYLNYITTHDSLEALFGQGLFWIQVFSWAVILADFGGFAKVLTPNTDKSEEPKWVNVIVWVWLAVTAFDMLFNVYFIALRLEQNPGVQAPTDAQAIVRFMPYALGILIWFVQLGLIAYASTSLDRALWGPKTRKLPAASHKSTAGPVPGQPTGHRPAQMPTPGPGTPVRTLSGIPGPNSGQPTYRPMSQEKKPGGD